MARCAWHYICTKECAHLSLALVPLRDAQAAPTGQLPRGRAPAGCGRPQGLLMVLLASQELAARAATHDRHLRRGAQLAVAKTAS